MGRIYQNQSALRLVMRTYTDLEEAEAASIMYRKPDRTTGQFPAGMSDREAGLIFYECLEGDIDQAGWWTFWASILYEDGRSAMGEASRVFVWKPGTV